MELTALGSVPVSRIIYGTRRVGEEHLPLLEQAVDRGINAFDVALHYNKGQAIRTVAALLKGRRDVVAVLGKVATHRPGDATVDMSPRALRAELDAQLSALRTDYLDILQVHYPDPAADYDKVAGVMDSWREAGLIREVGLSNFDRRELERWPADFPGVSLQLPYSLIQRAQVEAVRDVVAGRGLKLLPYMPLFDGVLVKGIGGPPQGLEQALPEGAPAFLTALREAAAAANVDPAVACLAWLLKDALVAAPLVGMTSARSLEAAVAAPAAAGSLPDLLGQLPSLPEPVLPMPAKVDTVLREGADESLCILAVGALRVTVWVPGAPKLGAELTLDGLSGKPLP